MRSRYFWFGLLASAAAASAAPPAFDWFAVSDLVKVFDDGYNCPPRQNSIEVFGMRGEYVSAQCVLAARSAIGKATVNVSPLVPDDRTASLAASSWQWNFVGSVPVPKNTPYVMKSRLIRLAPARFPDYLSEERSLALNPGQYQAVWLTLKIPPDAAPGTYSGTVTAETDRGSAALPARLTVYPLEMPEKRHLNVTLWFSTGKWARFYGIQDQDSDDFYRMLKLYAEMMASHRQNVFRVGLGTIRATENSAGRLSFDFSRFDRWAETFWSTGKMDLLETGFVARFGKEGFSSREIVLQDFKARQGNGEITVPGERYLPQFLPALERHLKEKGWLEKTVFHIADEPTNWNVQDWRKASEQVHRWAPSLRRIDAIEGTGFSGDLEIWVPKIVHYGAWRQAYEQARREGAELWYYTAMPLGAYPNRYFDYPLIETRIMHWLNYRFGLTGFLHWGFNAWTDNPLQEVNAERYGAGDAWHVYPSKNGLLSTIRYETMRNGLEDYEYFWMLEHKTAELKRRLGPSFSWITPSQRGVEIASKVIRQLDVFTHSPEVLYNARKEVAREILEFDRGPHLYVETTPRDGSEIPYGPARIEVRGWTDPGTEITVDGKSVPVAADGYFADAPFYLPQENVVVVAAKSAQGTKSVTRKFYSVPR